MHHMLEKVPIFGGMNPAALELLLQRARELPVAAQTVIVREGEPGNQMFLIGSGTVRICKNFQTAHEIELARLGPGNFFGEMCILETLPRAATAQAMVDSLLFGISSIAFYHLYQAMPQQYSILVLNIARDVSRRLRQLDEIFAGRH